MATEEKEIEKDVLTPELIKRSEHDMTLAPFLGVHKIEFEENYKDIEKGLKSMENSKENHWMKFFDMAEAISEKMDKVPGSLLVIETIKYRCLYIPKPGYESKKFRADGHADWPTPFLTWPELIDRMKQWKDKKFNPNEEVEPDVKCINRNFRHVHVYKHKKGLIFANQFDMVYPANIMDISVIMGKR